MNIGSKRVKPHSKISSPNSKNRPSAAFVPDKNEEQKNSPKQHHQVKPNKIVKNKSLKPFEGKLFFIETFQGGVNLIPFYQDQVTNLGGQVTKALTKQVDFVLFQEGSKKTVQKTILDSKYKNSFLVTPKFLEECSKAGILLEPSLYSPTNVEHYLRDDINSQESMITRSKKRREISNDSQNKVQERISKIKPKLSNQTGRVSAVRRSSRNREAQACTQDTSAAQRKRVSELEADKVESVFDYDTDEMEKTMREIRQENLFIKEFAKDVKMFSKLQQKELESSRLNESYKQDKKSTKQMNKDQLMNSFIEGEIDTVEFIEEYREKLNTKKNGKKKHHGAKSNKTITEMFQSKPGQQNLDITQEEVKRQNILNRGGIVKIDDYLFDLDKENSPINQIKAQVQVGKQTYQTSLMFDTLKSPFKVMHPGADLQKPLEAVQIQKSPTIPLNKDEVQTQEECEGEGLRERLMKNSQTKARRSELLAVEDRSLGFKGDVLARKSCGVLGSILCQRSYSLKKPVILGSNLLYRSFNDILNDTKDQSAAKRSRPQTQRKKKDWDKIIPKRDVATRKCRNNNVSYAEVDEESMDSDSMEKCKQYDKQFQRLMRNRHELLML